MDEARRALAHWPAMIRGGMLAPLGNAGGFSGARLWRLSTPAGDFCLKASPPGGDARRFEWMGLAAELPFVPAVVLASGLPTVLQGGLEWEVQAWMPGLADYRDAPSEEKLRSACMALGRLHEAWRARATQAEVVPAIHRRLQSLSETTPDTHLARLAVEARQELQAWLGKPVRLQPCLCDIWHDHVLFTGDVVTGVVDYSSMRVDAVAADVARLLGSLVGDDDKGWGVGLSAYAALGDEEARLARLLDRAGAVGAAIRWDRWLRERRMFANPVAARRRASEVLGRVRGWREATATPGNCS